LKQQDELTRKEIAAKAEEDELESLEDNYPVEDEKINEILAVNKAFKTIEILGQIIRNYPGSIKGEVKFQ